MASEKTKKIIIGTAFSLFEKNGFKTTKMDEIAKKAKVAKGSIYYHFKSKEELFAAVINLEFERLLSNLLTIVENNELKAGSKIRTYLITRIEVLSNANNYKEAVKLSMFENNTSIAKVRKYLENTEKEYLKRIVTQGIDEGDFDDLTRILDILMDIFMIVQKGLEIPFFVYNDYKKYSYHFYDLINILVKGLSKQA